MKADWLDLLLLSLSSSSNMSQEEDGRTQREEEEQAAGEEEEPSYNRLGRSGPAKSQTQRVMEQCERSGKTAPSVFGAKPAAQTGGTGRSAGPTNK